MSNLMGGKKYGLILPKGKGQDTPSTKDSLVRKKASIFNQSDSDSDNSDSDWVKKSMKGKASKSSGLKKQTKIVMAKALEEDPTVFQYDEVYDKIEENKVEEQAKKKEVDRAPKYIKNLLKAAEIRNKEFERRVERKVQKEREAEGEMYADKDSFVTGAYRRKMEEMAKEEEEERRKDNIEAALDVTRQNDLSGFYRHIYRQTHGEQKSELEDKIKQEEEDKIKKENEDVEESVEDKAQKVKEQMKKIKVEDVNPDVEDNDDGNVNIKKISGNKAFRKRTSQPAESSSGSDGDSSDSSGDSDSESETEKSKPENGGTVNDNAETELTAEQKMDKRRQEMREQKERREKRKRKIMQDESSSESEDEAEKSKADAAKKAKNVALAGENGTTTAEVEQVGQAANDAVVAAKIDIWKKRTVCQVLDAAVARYWQRVAERSRST